jgi:methionine aminopeptidase
MITPKTPEEIEKMRAAGALAADVLRMIAPHVKPGVSTEELDRLCHEHIVNVQQATPANVGYKGHPKATCISVNNVICHGIPNGAKVLPDGWTVVTKDRKLSAQWEHTVAVTETGVEILTRLPGDDNDL